MSNRENVIYNIGDLIIADKEKRYLKDYTRIRGGKKFNSRFEDYSEEYVKEMIIYFEDSGEYDKSGYLNLKLNGFKEHR